MIKPEARIENVKVGDLRKKVKAYRDLYGLEGDANIIVRVKGIFNSKDGAMAFLQHEFHTISLEKSTRHYVFVDDVDGEPSLLRPDHDIIDEIQIKAFQSI